MVWAVCTWKKCLGRLSKRRCLEYRTMQLIPNILHSINNAGLFCNDMAIFSTDTSDWRLPIITDLRKHFTATITVVGSEFSFPRIYSSLLLVFFDSFNTNFNGRNANRNIIEAQGISITLEWKIPVFDKTTNLLGQSDTFMFVLGMSKLMLVLTLKGQLNSQFFTLARFCRSIF